MIRLQNGPQLKLIMSRDTQCKNGGGVSSAPRPFPGFDLLGSHAAQDACGLTGEVRQDDVSAGPPQAHERLHHHLLLVDHAQGTTGFDHRVLAGYLNKGRD